MSSIVRVIILAACAGAVDALIGSPAVLAQEPGGGLGVVAWDTIGLTWKFIDPEYVRNAYETSAGWTIRGENAFEFHWMYQRIVAVIRWRGRGRTEIYAGAGFRVKLEDERLYGPRAAVGANFVFSREEISPEIFVEAVPTYDLAPEHGSSVGAGAGVRWRFF